MKRGYQMDLECLYDVKSRTLIYRTDKKQNIIHLTRKEHEFLLVINIDEVVPFKTFINALYYDEYNPDYIKCLRRLKKLKSNLVKKTSLNISTKLGYGYRLEEKVKFI